MKNEQRYRKTVDILHDAYWNGELAHTYCTADAVGNIIAANCNYNVSTTAPYWEREGEHIYPQYDKVFWLVGAKVDDDIKFTQHINPENYFGEAKEQIDATGYTWQELAKIDFAFVTAKEGLSKKDFLFNGLVAVLNVLKEIHEVRDDELNENESESTLSSRREYEANFTPNQPSI